MQQKYKIYISNQAEIELNRILDYIEYELLEPIIARNLFTKIKATILELENFPEKFPIVKSKYIFRENVRKCNVNNYIIIYSIDKKLKKVNISHIFYAKKNWMKDI